MYTEYGFGAPDALHITWCARATAENIVKHNDGYVLYARDISVARVVSVR